MEGGAIADFEKACQNAAAVQIELLTEILRKNISCEYLQRYGTPLNLESFQAQVPVVSYDDIWPDIQRVADGNTQPILCADPIVQFAHSSGTSSGKHKIIPQTLSTLTVQIETFLASSAYKNKYFPLKSSEPLKMGLLYCGQQHKTKSGLLVGAASTNYYRSEAFKQGSLLLTSPYELVVAGSDWRQTTYCHLLFGLLKREKVEIIYGLFAYVMCEAMRLLQREWKNLCHDISTRSLNSNITDEPLRSLVPKLLQQELENRNSNELADEISSICSSESWNGIIPLLWPRAKYLCTIVTGAMQPYVPALKRFAGDLPLVAFDYAASEAGLMGINTNPHLPPEEVVFTLSPFAAFFEFIPVDGDEESIVGFEGVEPGKHYELVLTNSRGLYRYKVGDVIKVVDFFHGAPRVAFSYRKNAVLSLTSEKVDEQELQKAVLSSTPDGLEVANFTSYAEIECEGLPHYVIFCELIDDQDYSRDEALQEFCEKIDKSFDNVRYLMGRVNKTIGPLELVLVKRGTFERLMEMAIQGGASPGQYKTPMCVTSPAMLELLKQNKVQGYKSQSDVSASTLKTWEPSFPEKRQM